MPLDGLFLHFLKTEIAASAIGSNVQGVADLESTLAVIQERTQATAAEMGLLQQAISAATRDGKASIEDAAAALAELRCATSGLQTVLREFLSCFPLIFRAFPAFCISVIRCADHKKRPFFIQRQADETHHLLPQTTPLVYCTSLLHKCP